MLVLCKSWFFLGNLLGIIASTLGAMYSGMLSSVEAVEEGVAAATVSVDEVDGEEEEPETRVEGELLVVGTE